MKKRCVLLFILSTMALLAAFPATAFAAGASAKASPSSVETGDTVTVRVTFSGKNIGAVQGSFSYDKNILKYISGSGTSSGGRIVLYTSSENASSLSTSIKFKALKAGKASVSVSASEILAFDESSLGTAKASASVTVKAPGATPSPKPSASKSPEPSPSPSVNPVDQAVKVTLDGQTLYLWTKLNGVKLPKDFKTIDAAYKNQKIQAASSSVVLAYLTDGKGKNGTFYVLENDELYPYVKVTANKAYTVVKPDSSVAVPQGYNETTLKLQDRSVAAWKTEKAPDFYLIYAMNSQGKKDFYTYDFIEGTMQRYTDRTVIVEVEKEPAAQQPEPQPEPQPSKQEAAVQTVKTLGFFEKLQSDSALMSVFTVFAGLIAILLAVNILLLVKKHKMEKCLKMQERGKGI